MKHSHAMYDAIKRVLDLATALALLVFLSPLLLALSLLVRVYMGTPVIFRQPRPGRDGRCFDMYKFRTMRPASEGLASARAVATDGQRLTRFGSLLRATSLDELPELWNVVRGDMSIVGPRPLLPDYLPLYNARQARRHEVRPGITGWAQVNGRNAVDWEDRFEMDVWYVDHRSFQLDARILLLTLGAVFKRQGVSAEGSATMPPFGGGGTRDKED